MGELPSQPDAQPNGDGTASVSPTGTDGAGRAHYKALALKYENDTLKLEMALRRHLRYPLPAVKRKAHGLCLALRASVERLIDQTAPRLAAEPNQSARLALLRAECAALGRAMRQELVRVLRRLRADQPKQAGGRQ